MDPITSTVIAGVLWFVLGSVATWLIMFLSSLVALSTENSGLGAFVGLLGWIVAVGLQVFVIIQVILHAVHVIQLIAGSA